MMITLSASAQYLPKFDLQGHRGARGLKPENTIPGFIEALNYGVTTVELDVVITKDLQVVVSHEPWMAAAICLKPDSTPIAVEEEMNFPIYKMNYSEVAAFDCGSRPNLLFPEQEKMKLSKPLLRDVIIAVENHIKNFSRYEVDYSIEIKSEIAGDVKYHPAPKEFSDLVYNLLDQYLPLERVVIQSFDFRVLKYWKKKYPKVRLAALVENFNSASSNLQALGFSPSVYSPDLKLLNLETVKFLQKKKIRVIPWTVNEIDDMKRAKAMGVDGFITDYPNRAAEQGFGLKKNGAGKTNAGAKRN